MKFRRLAHCAIGSTLLTLATAAQTHAQSQALPAELQTVRKLLDKYNDPVVAVYDGFYSTLGCIAYPNGGGEGASKDAPGARGGHSLNRANVGPTLDPSKPQVLISEPVGDKLKLVAA